MHAGLVVQLVAHPDAIVEMHYQLWEQTSGVHVRTSTMNRAIKGIAWTRQEKTLGASERDEDARAA